MLDNFGISHTNLHAAGNDAHYALRSLLMTAVTDGQKMEIEPTSKYNFSTFSAIARSARPTTTGEKAAAFEESCPQVKPGKKGSPQGSTGCKNRRRR